MSVVEVMVIVAAPATKGKVDAANRANARVNASVLEMIVARLCRGVLDTDDTECNIAGTVDVGEDTPREAIWKLVIASHLIEACALPAGTAVTSPSSGKNHSRTDASPPGAPMRRGGIH